MRFEDLKTGLKNWKSVNISFLHEQVKNRVTEKKKLYYTPELLNKIYTESTPVFFLSTGRCGTKYISNILKNSTLLDVFHHAFPELTFHQQHAYENPKETTTKSIIAGARIELLVESYRRNRIFIESNNRLTFFSFVLADLFPRSKFVHITRHPGDFVRSGLNRNWYSGKSSSDMGRIIPKDLDEIWPSLSSLEKIAGLWNETNLFIEGFKNALDDKSRLLTIKAEDIFTSENKLKEVFSFCGYSDNPTKVLKKYMRPVNVQNKISTSHYESWTDEDKSLVKKMTSLAKNYDYTL